MPVFPFSMFNPVHLGVDELGEQVHVNLAERNLLIGGEPGGGKSSALNLITAHGALSADCRLILVDGNQVQLGPWPTPVDAVEGGPAYQPVASASSGLPVGFVSLTPAVCGIQGAAVAPLAEGVCTISAEQAGDAEYEPAPPVTQSYSVAAAAPAGGPPAGGAPAAGGPAGEVLSLHETATPFTAHPALRLRGTPSVSRRNGAITLSLTVSPGGTVGWRMTFTRAMRCPLHAFSCARGHARFAAGQRPSGAGTVTVTVYPSQAALKLLRDRHALHVQALLTLTTASGTVLHTRSTILVRAVSSH